uniref:Uncharacterized protein n=1 Tax=Sphaerodactylus townsendi TaxID=933632 RepID=A0ACB8F9S1_9SAUR
MCVHLRLIHNSCKSISSHLKPCHLSADENSDDYLLLQLSLRILPTTKKQIYKCLQTLYNALLGKVSIISICQVHFRCLAIKTALGRSKGSGLCELLPLTSML